MGIFDFLATDKQIGRRKKKYDPDDTSDLGLGGLKSLLGTRGAASKDARGDAMMSKTANDNLPGYFNPETREYVPWYVDLFDGGGLNQSEGLLGKDAQEIPTAVGLLETNGAPVQRAAQMAPGIGTQLSDMERLNRMPGVDPRNLGGSEGYGPMGVDPRNLGGAEGYGPMGVDPRQMGGASGYGQTGVAQQMQPVPQAVPRDSVLNDLRRDVYTTGPIEAIASSVGDNFQVPEGFNQNVRGSDGTSFIPYGVPKPGEGLGVETFGPGNAYSNQHYSVDPAYPAFIKSFPEALEQPSIIPLLLAQYKAKRGL